jgi:hypothetical protein
MPDYFKSVLTDEKTLENLEFTDKIMSIQSHLINLLDAEEHAPDMYRYGYQKALLDFASLLYEAL